jgi:hypothetical protein
MIDPDNFRKGKIIITPQGGEFIFERDTPAEMQLKRIALTWDILAKYSPILQAISERPLDDPNRLNDWNKFIKKMKKEMDKRFIESDKRPIIKPILIKKGHPVKGGRPGVSHFIFNIGIPFERLHNCARPGCQNQFMLSKFHRKYCSPGCEERAKRDRYIQKRRERMSSKG